eukprot:CAMPEP_0195521266 /NCGR_PEP_ID=MMETSP0794_2-20130614/18336_1 /TAXON_ID=515487 /ORGANISM="Stephanopyxis turris, Strain CCMP 815" /LENGTH=206 /DNA_ID=CAMNT_0040650785 /DNA_START=74 /DNA_END=694 /DNA_ORIENTATION=-
MPPKDNTKRKKPKGRAPAHQNSYAFHHNPKSKLTDKILSSPNVGCCKRCHEKIEWRKKYRKYKPRTQPGTCNLCKRRNVKAAYHTICSSCAYQNDPNTTNESEDASGSTEKSRVRMCAVCVKEKALSGDNSSETESVDPKLLSNLKLRERRTVERKLRKEQESNEKNRKGEGDTENDFELEDYEYSSSEEEEDKTTSSPENVTELQ